MQHRETLTAHARVCGSRPLAVEFLWEACDNDGSGEIDYPEFVQAFGKGNKGKVVAQQAAAAVEKQATPKYPTPPPSEPTLRECKLMRRTNDRDGRLRESALQAQLAAEEAERIRITNLPKPPTPVDPRVEMEKRAIALAQVHTPSKTFQGLARLAAAPFPTA